MGETKQEFDQNFERLTPRQRDVLQLIIEGKSNKEIAEQFDISEGTVRKYVQNICDTLQVEGKGGRSRKASLIRLVTMHQSDIPEESEPGEGGEGNGSEVDFDPEFVGRDDAIADLDRLVAQGDRCIVILSPGGRGKTTLAWRYLRRQFKEEEILYFPIAKERKDIASIESLVEEQLRKLGEKAGLEFMVSLERLRQKLMSQRFGILIDNLEPALDESGLFVPEHRGYFELLRVLCDPSVQSITLITSREKLKENIDLNFYPLSYLNQDSWRQYFEHKEVSVDGLDLLHESYQGNALAMKVLCKQIFIDYSGNLRDYLEFNETPEGLLIDDILEKLIAEQFDRLEGQSPNAYKLLCRLGCFRYQDIETVPRKGIFSLCWDFSKEGKMLRILLERSLVDVQQQAYKLHPIVRAEAIARLRVSGDLEKTNQEAAFFWFSLDNKADTIDDVTMILEAYYHYYSISDFLSAGLVFTKQLSSKWALDDDYFKGELLGRSLYRFGLTNKAILLIESVASKSPMLLRSRLLNILGDCYWLQGRIKLSLSTHEASLSFSESLPEEGLSESQRIEVLSLKQSYYLNTGLCYLDLFEIKLAQEKFQELRRLSNEEDVESNSIIPPFCLSFTHSCLGQNELALENLRISESYDSHTQGMGTWTTAYRLLFIGLSYLNLEYFDKSEEYLNKSLEHSRKSRSIQVEGNTLIGIAELARAHGDFDSAISNHGKSIKILKEEVDADCDLAEAYYQRALTYQAMGDPRSQADFAKALKREHPTYAIGINTQG